MNPRFGRVGVLCALACAAIAVIAPAAQAEWLPPVDISETGEHVGVPDVALDSEGNATATWDRWNGTSTVVETAYRAAGSPWGAPKVLSPPDSWGAHVVVDRNGVLTAAWQRWTGTNHFAIESASRLPGNEWTEPVEVTDFQQGFHPEPWLAVDWEGNTTVVWTQGERIMSSFRTFALGWGEPIPISPEGSVTPQAAMDARGDATAVWMHNGAVEGAYRPEQGEWGEPTLISQPGEVGGNPQVAVDGKGDSLVVWQGEDEGVQYARASYRTAEGEWSPPVDVSIEGDHVQALQSAVDPEGNAIVAWSGNFYEEGEHDTVRAAFKPAGEGWEAPVDLSAPGGNGFPSDVVFDQSGNAAIVWERWDGVTNLVQAAYKPAGEEWEEPVDLSEEGKQGMNAAVVLDAPGSGDVADGDATTIWISASPVECASESEEGACHSYVVQAAGYDPDGLPEVEVEAPAEAEVGVPVEIATPTQGLYSPLIDFGDGESFSGTEAVHVYDEPGEYFVRAGGAEELGYRSVGLSKLVVSGGKKGGSRPDLPDLGGSPGGAAAPPLACAAAQQARKTAAARLRKLRSKLAHAEGAKTRRLAAAKRRQLAALRRARARVAASC